MSITEHQLECSTEHAWGMAIHSLMTSASAVYEMSRSVDYQDLAVKDLGQISEAALAISLAWSALKKRESACSARVSRRMSGAS
jgi:hypothetical protein